MEEPYGAYGGEKCEFKNQGTSKGAKSEDQTWFVESWASMAARR